jgi:hypothetical protein
MYSAFAVLVANTPLLTVSAFEPSVSPVLYICHMPSDDDHGVVHSHADLQPFDEMRHLPLLKAGCMKMRGTSCVSMVLTTYSRSTHLSLLQAEAGKGR